jgi:hypothetical protein
MIFWILIVIGVSGIILGPLGYIISYYPIAALGFTIPGISFILFGILVKSRWKGFNGSEEKALGSRFFTILGGVILLGFGVFILSDAPAYITGDYEKIQGIPSELEWEIGHRTPTKTLTVTIKEQTFVLEDKLGHHLSEEEIKDSQNLEERTFVIYYLPRTKIIMDYYVE